MTRLEALQRLYERLNDAQRNLGGPKFLGTVSPKDVPPDGVYFFFEPGEHRRETGSGLRAVRVGTHAVTATSKSTLWQRLGAHRGHIGSHGGNHRGSVFRLLIGEALSLRDPSLSQVTWGRGSTAPRAVRDLEAALERAATEYMWQMPFVWLEAPTRETRAALEASAIALLSNYHREPLDGPSVAWLGNYSLREKVRSSGLWNRDYVDLPWNERIVDLLGTANV